MNDKRKMSMGLFLIIIIAAVSLTQSGQHGQISGFVSSLLGGR